MKKVADTVETGYDENYGDQPTVLDISDSLHFNSLLLQVHFTGASDVETSQFFEYRGDSLKLLFEINDLRKIYRKDAHTLAGFVSDRDEVVYSFQDDYPFVISLPPDTVIYYRPDRPHIGYTSE